jgi:uncharacterized membrane protein HdeD (DUF308 family)
VERASRLFVLFGGLILIMPGAGALSLIWLIGAYALAFGVLFLATTFRFKRSGTLSPAAGVA